MTKTLLFCTDIDKAKEFGFEPGVKGDICYYTNKQYHIMAFKINLKTKQLSFVHHSYEIMVRFKRLIELGIIEERVVDTVKLKNQEILELEARIKKLEEQIIKTVKGEGKK